MNSTFQISEVFQSSWKYVKTQIWVLAGLLIGMCLISLVINLFTIPLQDSVFGMLIAYLISLIISAVFCIGYTKNMFQTMDGDEPQFSAYLQNFPKIINMLVANILMFIIVCVGLWIFVLPGIYLYLRLQFFVQFIVDEDAGIIDSLNRSWKVTKGKEMSLLLLALTEIFIFIIGAILFGIGLFIAIPVNFMMNCYVYRKLNRLKAPEA